MTDDVFRAPTAEPAPARVKRARGAGVADGPLFTGRQIMAATFLGSALAGGVLVGINARRLGRSVRPVVAWIGGLALVLLLVGVGLPQLPSAAFTVGAMIGVRGIADLLHGPAVAAHFAAGGERARWSVTLLVGLGGLALLAWALLVGLMLVGVGF
jgi:hypothetical protein